MRRRWAVGVFCAMVVSTGAGWGQGAQSGLVLEQAGQLEQAQVEYIRVLGRNPADLTAFQGLVRVSRSLGRSESLVAVARRLADARPEQPEYAVGLVEGLLGLTRSSEAVAVARSAARKWPERAAGLAEALAAGREYGEAASFFRQARQQSGDSLAFADRLAAVYELKGEFRSALREVVALVNRNPKSIDAYRQKLRAYQAKAGAGQVLALVADIGAQDARALAQATVLLAAGREAEAVRAVQSALDPAALARFAQECESEGTTNAALALYRGLGRTADAGRVLRRLGRAAEARAELAGDNSLAALLELGEIESDGCNWSRAEQVFGRALAQEPGSEPAAFGLASCLAVQGNTRAARETAGRLSRSSDRLLLLVAQTFFYDRALDSVQATVAELCRRHPQSLLVNDALELSLLAGSGEKAAELGPVLLDYAAGRDAGGLASVLVLVRGGGAIADQASLIAARFQRRLGRPKDALSTLDSLAGRSSQGQLAARARLEQARIFRDDLKDEGRCRATLQQLAVEFPGSAYVPVARSMLAELDRAVPAGGIR